MDMFDYRIKKDIDNIILVVFILVSTSLLTDVFYSVVLGVSTAFGIDITEWASNNDFFMDTLFCFFAVPLFGIWFITRFGNKRHENQLSLMPALSVTAFGVGGIAMLWLSFLSKILGNVAVISESMDNFRESWSGMDSEPYIWVFMSVVIAGPIFEEIVFRGLIYNYIEELGSSTAAIIVSGITFGIWHGEPVQMVYTAFMGIVLGIVYYRTRSLKYTIYVHIVNNLLSTLPPFLDTDINNAAISYISYIMIIPMLVIVYNMSKYRYNDMPCKENIMSEK